MKKFIIILFFILGPLGFANVPKYSSLGVFVDQEMDSQASYMDEYNLLGVNESIKDSWFYMNFISLTVEGIIGLEVPFFASFELRPVLVLRWKRKIPEGYVKYKPDTE